MIVLPGLSNYNNALHQATIPLRFIVAGEISFYVIK